MPAVQGRLTGQEIVTRRLALALVTIGGIDCGNPGKVVVRRSLQPLQHDLKGEGP